MIKIILLFALFTTKSLSNTRPLNSDGSAIKNATKSNQKKSKKSEEDLEVFLETFKETKVSLIMTTEYYNAPASALGHTLLIFHNGVITDHSQVIHFSAVPNPDDSFLTYISKGISGGYKSYYFREYFFKKKFEYLLKEERDLYIYDLKLSELEILNLKKILFEMQFKDFDYFFFTENCSYRLLEIINLARGAPLSNHLIYAPYDLVLDLEDIIDKKTIIYSHTKMFLNFYNQYYIEHPSEDFLFRPIEMKNSNLSHAVFHYNISQFRAGRLKKFTNNFSSSSPAPTEVIPTSTNVFKKVSTLGLMTTSNGIKGISLRPLYKDYRDFQEKNKESTMNLLEFEIREIKSSISLYEFTIFELGTTSSYNKYLNNFSWGTFLGRRRIHSKDKHQFASALTSIGLSKGRDYLIGSHINLIYSERVILSPEFSFMRYFNDNFKISLKFFYHLGYEKNFITTELRNTLKLSKNLDLALIHESLPENYYSLEFRLHF